MPSLRSMSPTRAVWTVAWPMAALGLLRSFYYLTDSFWVGKLGPTQLAALGGSAFAWWMINLGCELAATGAHARIARHEGAGELARIPTTLAHAIALGLLVSALLALVYPLRHVYFDLLGFSVGSPEHGHGQAYVGAALLGASTLAVHAVVGAAFRGLGDTRVALALTAATLVANAALDPLLIWGLGPIPAFGVAGAAWATALANALGAALGFWLLASRGHRVRWLAPTAKALWEIARIGAPVSLSGLGFALVYVLLGRVITGFGSEQMAALGVGHRLESLAYFCCVAFGVGAATMVGQHLGAGDVQRARQSAASAARLALAAMLPFPLLLFALARPLFGLFTDDPATLDAGVLYLRIQTAVLALMALEETYKGAFAGSGRPLAASLIGFGFTAARIPAAWVLAYPLGLGIAGVWLAIAASTAIKGALLWLLWLRRPPA